MLPEVIRHQSIGGEMIASKCRKCGESFQRLAIFALMVDAGARVHPSPLRCSADGGEHDFAEVKPVPERPKKPVVSQ